MNATVENLPTISEKAGDIMEAVIARGDLAQLNPQERAKYYTRVCESIGLNPLTKPFEYITLNGKLTLYARKDTTDQLRTIHNISVIDMTESERDGLVIVTVKVRNGAGRTDMAKGAVSLKGLQGEALANAIMKAETKAKRRATLSICGLGFLNDVEVDDIPSDVKRYTKTKQAAKDLYSAMEAEVHSLTSAMEAGEWLRLNSERLKLLPADWEDFLRTSCHDLIMSAEPQEIWRDEEPEELPEPPASELPQDDSKWDALGPVKQAGILCSDPGFWKFLTFRLAPVKGYIANEDDAADYVREYCGIESRKELSTNARAAKLWRELVADYRAWQREPDTVEVPPHPTHHDQGGAVDQPEPARTTPAGSGAVNLPSPRQPEPRAGDPPPAAVPSHPTAAGGEVLSIEDEAREAAKRGEPVFQAFYKRLTREQKAAIAILGEELRGLMNEAANA